MNAFDKVFHPRLLRKLDFYGVRGSLHSWISSFLRGRTQVLLDGVASTSAPVQSGVPQWSVLGPLLFLLPINDLSEYISPGLTARLFADDCVLFRHIESEADACPLQQVLDRLQQRERDWLVEFHPKECQVLHITCKRKHILVSYTIHGHTLEEVSSAKYLGVTLQKNLSWNTHIDSTAKKANNTRAFLQRNLQQYPRKTKELCYKTLVRPIMEYASVVWDPFTEDNIRKLEMVKRRAARMVYSDYRRTSSVTPMLQQLQWTNLQERRAQAKVIMVYRIVYDLVDIPVSSQLPYSRKRKCRPSDSARFVLDVFNRTVNICF